mmetsp:Transcript_12914/g.16135  ORF Transcript_12914/g.16135 Transcript_12914/m.16135 type:complete len:280 (+) Transcript_12914:3-842(+)
MVHEINEERSYLAGGFLNIGYNEMQLAKRFCLEVSSAFTASVLVSPLVSIIDKAAVQEIVGIVSFGKAVNTACGKMLKSPFSFLSGTPFLTTVAVYFGTYSAANLSEFANDYAKTESKEIRKTTKVASATVANLSLLAWRDALFAKMYTTNKPAGPVPKLTTGCFWIRDGATMLATFYLAPYFADHVTSIFPTISHDTAYLTTALSVPVITQIFTAPLHIFAFDYYVRPMATYNDRYARILLELPKVCLARCGRILPAFGIGAYSNRKLRESWVSKNSS